MELLIIAAILGLIPAVVASKKGRSFLGWWIYGAALFIVALPHSLMLKDDRERIDIEQARQGLRQCPFCAEWVRPEAIVCKHCGRDIPRATPTRQVSAPYISPLQR